MSTPIGKIHQPNALFFRVACGTATLPDGTEYELCTHAGTGSPLVRNTATNITFSLSWEQILDLAKEAGIDNPPTGPSQADEQPQES